MEMMMIITFVSEDCSEGKRVNAYRVLSIVSEVVSIM
jgi:hypothetical protein